MLKNAIEEVIFYIKHYSLPLSILLTCDAWLSVVTDFEALASFYTWFQKFAEVVSLVYDVKRGCEVCGEQITHGETRNKKNDFLRFPSFFFFLQLIGKFLWQQGNWL